MPYTTERAQRIIDLLTEEGLDLSRWEVGGAPNDGLKLFTYGTRRALWVNIVEGGSLLVRMVENELPRMLPVTITSHTCHSARQAARLINETTWARPPASTHA